VQIIITCENVILSKHRQSLQRKDKIMYRNLLIAVLTPIVAFVVRLAVLQIGVELDEGTFNAIVAGIVGLFVSLFFGDIAAAKAPQLFK
jgi:hypothetical protein